MSLASFETPIPLNEPIHAYAPGSAEKRSLQARLEEMKATEVEVPMVIGGERVTSGELADMRPPHEHARLLGRYHKGNQDHLQKAIGAALEAKKEWASWPWEDRAAVMLKAADLLAGPHRDTINGATMLGQGKNCFQAEIDAACELIDFLRFNVAYAREIYAEQPLSVRGIWNRVEYRPLDGFVLAVTPFNFTAIAGNLPTAAALMGNGVVWKPSRNAMYSAYFFLQVMEEAGMPPGVINLIMGNSSELVPAAMAHPDFSGLHYTGSLDVLKRLYKVTGDNMDRYRTFPRIVGEAGGKDYIFVHESADAKQVAAAFVRGGYEYQGQKCSAASRIYVPRNRWPEIKQEVLAQLAEVKVGIVEDFSNFVNAVIDKGSFQKIKGYIDRARESSEAEIVHGGKCDDSEGWFVEPTVIETTDPHYESMEEEIFGPVVTVYPYDPAKASETLEVCDQTSAYGLTGAVFSQDRRFTLEAAEKLRFSAGNFYINDKCTGSVVGQQPFGGSRLSGTNDKAGSKWNLIRWTSPRSIKETFVAPRHFGYPFHGEG